VRCSARATTSPPRSRMPRATPSGQLQAFRTSPSLRIAVTVDMIATGTDVKPLECVFFMRDVRSAQYFEQMKGRGARTIASRRLPVRHPGRRSQDPLRHRRRRRRHRARLRRPAAQPRQGISLKKLLDKAATLTLTEDETATLASRLAKLELELTPDERTELDEVASRRCVTSSVPSSTRSTRTPRPRLSKGPPIRMQARRELLERAITRSPPARSCAPASSSCAPPTTASSTRSTPTSCSTPTVSSTRPGQVGRRVLGAVPARPPRRDHRDPARHRSQGAAHRLRRHPGAGRPHLPPAVQLDPRHHLDAYEAVDVGRVRHSDRHTLTDLVSLLRYTVGVDNELVPYAARGPGAVCRVAGSAGTGGTEFSPLERWWLDRMVDVIASLGRASPPTTSTAHPSPRRAASTAPCATSATAPATCTGICSTIWRLNAELTA
jgi:type I restriction enzyme R subunit